jgi:hypothetical protein
MGFADKDVKVVQDVKGEPTGEAPAASPQLHVLDSLHVLSSKTI